MHISAFPRLLRGGPPARLHPAEQPLDHLRGALRRAEVAELDARHLASGQDDVEPHDFAGLEVDQRGIIELLLRRRRSARRNRRSSRRGREPRARCARPKRPGPRHGGTRHSHSRSSGRAGRHLAKRPVEALAALGRQDNRRDICGATIEWSTAQFSRSTSASSCAVNAGQLVAVLDDRHLAAARGLLRAKRVDDAGARLLGPVGARLDHAAGGQRTDGHVGAEHQELVIALRRRELDVGILLRLHACRRETLRRQQRNAKLRLRITDPPKGRTRLPASLACSSCLNAD